MKIRFISLETLFLAAVLLLPVLACQTNKIEIIENKCSTCHSTSIIYEKKRTCRDWGLVLFGMKNRGLKIRPDEEKEIKDVLCNKMSLD